MLGPLVVVELLVRSNQTDLILAKSKTPLLANQRRRAVDARRILRLFSIEFT